MSASVIKTLSITCLLIPVGVRAQSKCQHQGNDVICPSGVSPGSSSVNFTPTGIRWSDGATTTGFNVPLYVNMPAPMGTPSMPALPDSGGDLAVSGTAVDSPSPDSINTDLPDRDDLGPGVITIGDQMELTHKDPPPEPRPPVPLLTTKEFEELEALLAPDLSGTRSIYETKDASIEEERKKLVAMYQGTGDLAGVAEGLLSKGGGLRYSQVEASSLPASEQGNYIGGAMPSQMLGVTSGNCYEFIHYIAWMAGRGTGEIHNIGGGTRALLDIQKMQTWDTQTDIPRGMVIVGCVGYGKGSLKSWVGGTPQDDLGFIHVGISLGNGMVMSNRGSGLQIEKMSDVFGEYSGGLSGGKVYFGQYSGYRLPGSRKEFLETETVEASDGAAGVVPDLPEGEVSELDREEYNMHKEYIEKSKEKKAVLDAFDKGKPLKNPTDFQKDYDRFLTQGLQGAGEKPFFFISFETWKASELAAKDMSGEHATAMPPSDYVVPHSTTGPPKRSQFGYLGNGFGDRQDMSHLYIVH